MLPYEAVRVVLVLRALFVTTAPDQLICPVNLPLTDLSLVVRVFQGKGYDQPLLEGLCAFAELPARLCQAFPLLISSSSLLRSYSV